jgi:hypothetical protein
VQSLPSKPWKKVAIEALAEHRYRILFLSEFSSEAEFLQAVEEDIVSSLGLDDEMGTPDWPSRSVTLTTPELTAFKRNLVFACVMVEPQ